MKLSILVPIKPNKSFDHYLSVVKRFNGANLVFGLDDDDEIGKDAVNSVNMDYVTIEKEHPFPICKLWNKMASYAFEKQKSDYVLLLGDDCRLIQGLDELLKDIFSFPEYEVIAVKEYNHPSWPTFLACTKRFFPIPKEFVNQDADPFIFESARRMGLSTFTKHIHINNECGGVEGGLVQFTKPRYERQSTDWKKMLKKAQKITIDIAIPMYRVNVHFIKSVLDLPYDEDVDTRVSVCIDNELSHKDWCKLRNLELEECRLRIRVNEQNIGASATRTRLWNDNHSEYVLFMDDDVVPDKDIIKEYVNAIKTNPNSPGFVGMSRLPFDERIWTDGIHVNSTFFWHISEFAFEHNKDVPWGVTANIMFKWKPGYAFDERFPKTGGGEDIDFCIQAGARFTPVPTAKIIHPWRDSPIKMYYRMFQWAKGDGFLNIKYPNFTYWYFGSFPLYFVIWLFLAPRTWYVPCIVEIYTRILWTLYHDHSKVLQNKSLIRKIGVILVSTIADNASEFGHLYCNLQYQRIDLLFKRFDWFLGTLPSSITHERQKSFFFVINLVLVKLGIFIT